MRIPNAYYLIVDVEATCSDDGSVPRDEMEIIEIGAVMQDAQTFEVESEFQTMVRPVRHPELTDFCTKLTGITSYEVENAVTFPEAMESMRSWMSAYDDALFCSWGDYDRGQFEQDCAFHQVQDLFGQDHLNLKAAFSLGFGLQKRFGVSGALRRVGLAFEGRQHRGLDDAKNIARIVRRICIGI